VFLIMVILPTRLSLLHVKLMLRYLKQRNAENKVSSEVDSMIRTEIPKMGIRTLNSCAELLLCDWPMPQHLTAHCKAASTPTCQQCANIPLKPRTPVSFSRTHGLANSPPTTYPVPPTNSPSLTPPWHPRYPHSTRCPSQSRLLQPSSWQRHYA
jgi:hypothetical protein